MRILFPSLVLTALLSTSALANAELATVNGVAIPQSRYDAVVSAQSKEAGTVDDATKAKIKEQLITNEVIRQEAVKKGLDKRPTYTERLGLLKEKLLLQTFIEEFVNTHPISDATLKQQYNKIKKELISTEYRVRHILVGDEVTARELIEQLKNGAKFEVLAKEKSKDSGSAAQGGDLGWAPADAYVPAFAEAVKKMPNGKISDTPIKTDFGWHIIQVLDSRTGTPPSFNEIKPELSRHMQNEALQKYVVELVGKAKITR